MLEGLALALTILMGPVGPVVVAEAVEQVMAQAEGAVD